MKHFHNPSRFVHNRILSSAALFLFATSAILSAQPAKTYDQITAAHPGWVQVPGELIRPDCVHEIPNGAKIIVGDNGEPTGDVTLNGQVIAHYDSCPEAAMSTRHTASAPKTPGHTPGPPFNGWSGAPGCTGPGPTKVSSKSTA